MSQVSIYGVNNFASEKPLYLNDCGVQKFGTNDPISVIRENGRFDYHMLLMKTGNCTFKYHDQLSILNEDELLIYFPNEPQEYYFGNAYSESYWLHFSGSLIPSIIDKCAIKSGFFKFHPTPQFFDVFDELISIYQKQKSGINNSYFDLKISTLLLFLLCRISENIYSSKLKITVVTQVLNHIHTHYNEEIVLKDLARSHGIGERRLNQLFVDEIGTTPHTYKRNLQIENAKNMLIYSKMNITDISIKVGFDDPLYFSRVFKKHTHMSPRQYKTTQPREK